MDAPIVAMIKLLASWEHLQRRGLPTGTFFPGVFFRRFPSCRLFFSSRRRHTRFDCDWSSDVCSSDLTTAAYVEWDITAHIQAQRAASATAVSLGLKTTSSFPDTETVINSRENAANKPILIRSEERRVGKEGRCRATPR